jgi:hypothetical protein
MIKHTLKRISTALSCLIGLTASAAATTARAQPNAARACSFTSSVSDPALLRGCVKVVGDLHLEHSTAENLKELSALRTVTGTLFITENPRLRSLEGLSNLYGVGALVVSQNPALENINGLDSLEYVSRLEIRGNRALRELSGPDAVRHLDKLVVSETDAVRLAGFESLASVREVIIAQNPKLIDAAGISHRIHVKNLFLADNPRLAPLASLARSFKSHVTVRRELAVTSLPGVRLADARN